jgi:hypothetical protein
MTMMILPGQVNLDGQLNTAGKQSAEMVFYTSVPAVISVYSKPNDQQ